MRQTLLIGFATVLLPLTALAQSNPPVGNPATTLPTTPPVTNARKLSPVDAHFVRDAAASGIAEVQAGHIASQQGDATVKAVGEKMVADHTQVNAELGGIAKAQGFDLPSQPDPSDTMTLSQLGKARGRTFNTQYLTTELTDHQKAIALFKQEADQGNDAELKAFAAKTLPTLEDHLHIIQQAMHKTRA